MDNISQQEAAARGMAPSGTGGASTAVAALDPIRLIRVYYLWLVAAGVIGTVLGVGAYMGLKIVAPKYDSSAIYQARSAFDRSQITDIATESISGEEAETFMQTQVRIIQSERVISRVLAEPSVRNTTWYKKFVGDDGPDLANAAIDLEGMIQARVIPRTTLFEFTVTAGKADDAVAIAEAVHTVFMADHRETTTNDINTLIRRVNEDVKLYDSELTTLRNQAKDLLANQSLQSVDVTTSSFFQRVLALEPKLADTREQRILAQQQLADYLRIRDQDTAINYPEAVRVQVENSIVARNLESQVKSLSAELVALREKFGPNSNSVETLLARRNAIQNEYQRYIEEETAKAFTAAIQNLENSIASLSAAEQSVSADLEEAKLKLTEISAIIEDYTELSEKTVRKSEQLTLAQNRLSDLQLANSIGIRVKQVEAPQVPKELAFPKLIPTTALGFLLICGAVAGVILVKELKEDRVRGPNDIRIIARTRVLGIIPELSLDPSEPEEIETATREKPLGVIAESVRELRNAIGHACAVRGHHSILFTSGMPGSGTSTLVANLAEATAHTERKVLVIDANVRRPSMHQIFRLELGPGLAELLDGRSTDLASVVRDGGGFDVLTAGKSRGHVYEMFNTERMARILEQAKEQYSLVLIDAAPVVVANDAMALTSQADASVLVVKSYSEKRGLVSRVRNQLVDAPADFLGVIVNGVRASAGGYLRANYRATVDYTDYSSDAE